MFKIFLLILIWIIGIIVFALSFLFGEQIDFSPSQETEEKIFKNTGLTKLTRRLRNIHISLILVFFVLVFLYNYVYF